MGVDEVAALEEAPSRPGRQLFQLLRADGLLTPMALLGALTLAAAGVELDRKMLADLAVNDPAAFGSLVDVARQGLEGEQKKRGRARSSSRA